METTCLYKVISGGQTGVDQAALRAAKSCGLLTGGYMPKGWLTLAGPKPEFQLKYRMVECSSPGYPARTYVNVKASHGTLRIAKNFDSPGELCTLKAIKRYQRPYFDVRACFKLSGYLDHAVESVINWLQHEQIGVLNVAGNTERTAPGIGEWAEKLLVGTFSK
jgi:hypothetical protein